MEMWVFITAILLLAPTVLSIVALIIASRSRGQQDASPLSSTIERHEGRLAALEYELRALRERLKPIPAATASEAQPAGKGAVQEKAIPKPAPTPSPIPPPVVIPAGVAEKKTAPRPIVVPAPPPAGMAVEGARGEAPPPSQPSTAAPGPARRLPSFDWEGLVGVKLFSWIAGVALLLAAVFFLRYSIDRGWLMPPVRMVIGILVGIGLLTLCELKAARRYPVTANAMDASAIAILFSTFFAAHALWNLIGTVASFVLLALVTVIAVLLSIRRDSMFIALLGLLGGFSTPALLSTGENRPISLFGYLLLLNAGLAWIATRKKWPVLTTLSLVFTVLYQWAWVVKFLTAGQLPLAVGIFLIFPILTFAGQALDREEGNQGGWMSLYGQTANMSATVPLLFAFYLAVVPGYGTHTVILFGFLFLLDAGLFAVAAARRQEILHLTGGLSTILVFAVWMMNSYQSWAWPGVLPFIVLFVLFYLAAPLVALHCGQNFTNQARKAVYVAPLLFFCFPALAALEPDCANPALLFSVLFLVLVAAAAFATFQQEGRVYFLSAFFTLLAEAIWSSKYLTPERLLVGLTLYGIFALFYLGVPLLAHHLNKALRPQGAGAILLLASLGLLFFLSVGPVASVALWGLALLLLVLNVGLFFEGSVSGVPLISLAGIVLSWIVLAVWWGSVSLAAILLPALIVVAGFAMLALAGNIWLQKHVTGDRPSVLANGIFLGLVGHLFLFIVAGQKSLAIPPWPLLGVLLVLDLAVGVAALYARRGELHLAAIIASAFILISWTQTAIEEPWPAVAIFAAGVLVLFAYVWIFLARRLGIEGAFFPGTAAGTAILAQVIAIVAAAQSGSPSAGFLLATHLVLVVALLALAWVREWHFLALVATLSTAAAVFNWQLAHREAEFWPQQLLLAAPMYLVFLVYPLLLGRRAGRALGPYLAAVFASAFFFFQARHIMLQAGWAHVIGILPVTQALMLLPLLFMLLRIEVPGARMLGRLALVAGATLAFITVAIPLQLEKEWITIGWALEGAALAWLFGRIPHRGLFYTACGLLAVVFARLALNPSVLMYQPRGAFRIWNWYLYAYLISAAALILAGWLLSKTKAAQPPGWQCASGLLPAGGTILLFLLLNIEIADFFSEGESITFNFSATLAQDLTYTLGWALFAVVLLGAGIALRSQPARIASLALLAATILKCFLHDLARLGGLYRVVSFVGLAVCLALVAMALQKFVLSARKEID